LAAEFLSISRFSAAPAVTFARGNGDVVFDRGKKGRPRVKPPFPIESGLWGKPTLINNVETLANIPVIIAKGADWYKGLGTKDSPGTKLISLSGDVRNRGLYEVPFGTTFREIIENYGGGMKEVYTLKAVNIGGASGVVVPPEELDCPMEYGVCAARGITIGSGAVYVMDERRSILDNVQNRVNFFLHESCGKCTPAGKACVRQSGLLKECWLGRQP
jgi:NADH:ubiquinone oxidoreductase subunit F (NADH-binding)